MQVIFSSLWEQLVTFTRDYDGIKAVLDKVEDYDKTCLEGGLLGAANLLLNEWDIFTPCQVNYKQCVVNIFKVKG